MISIRTLLIAGCILLLCSFRADKFDYTFRIWTNQTTTNLPKDLTVEIINNEDSAIKLDNLVFNFYVDNDGYFATNSKARFLDKPLTLQSKAHFKQTIPINSLTFAMFGNGKSISTMEAKMKLSKSRIVRIAATISDIRKLENPLSSSSLTHSNIIELQAK